MHSFGISQASTSSTSTESKISPLTTYLNSGWKILMASYTTHFSLIENPLWRDALQFLNISDYILFFIHGGGTCCNFCYFFGIFFISVHVHVHGTAR